MSDGLRLDVVFHARVPLAVGSTELLPASELAALDPDAHARAMAKYDDTAERRRLRDTAIPGSSRTWTQFVFFSPVHPHAIWDQWRRVRGKELPRAEFWAIPVGDLPDGTVELDRRLTATGDPIDPREVRRFDPAAFTTATALPPASLAWLTEMARRGVSGAWFHGIPHVLSPGPVPVKGASIIGWEEPF